MATKKEEEKKYQIWLSNDRGNSKLILPVLPESYQYRNGSKNVSVDIAGLGEVVVMQDPPARVISFSSFFPKTYNRGNSKDAKKITKGRKKEQQEQGKESGLGARYTDPVSLYREINSWKNGDVPVLLNIIGAKVSFFCTIEEFDKEEKGGDPGTIYYHITLKEYRETKVRKVTIDPVTKTTKITKAKTRVDNAVKPKTHTMKPGENLYTIAKRFTGDGSNSKDLYAKNKEILDAHQYPRFPNYQYAGPPLTLYI